MTAPILRGKKGEYVLAYGRGDGPVAAALQPPPVPLAGAKTRAKSDSELLNVIRNGRGVMPGWNSQLEEQELRDVLAYLRTLRE